MAGGKETPRQKMIGMMYLVLTALLALQVSNAVLDKFIFIDKALTRMADEYGHNNINTVSGIEAQVAKRNNKEDEVAILNIAKEVRAKTAEVIKTMSDLKLEMVEITGGRDPETGELIGAKDYDKVGTMMVGPQGKGKALKKMLNDYAKFLVQKTGEAEDYFPPLALDGDVMYPNSPNQKDKNFAEIYFENTPTAAGMAGMSYLETEIMDYERKALAILADSVGAGEISFDKIFPLIRAESNIVAAGAKYKAEMFIAASSSALKPVMYKDGKELELGDLNIAGNKIKYGQIEFSATPGNYGADNLARKTFKVKIDLEGKEYVDTISYMVAKPTILISSSALSALWQNCGNALSVQVPSLGNSYNPNITASNASVVKGTGKGEVTIIPKTRGKVTLTVRSSGAMIGSKTFSVKKIPLPKYELVIPSAAGNMHDGVKGRAFRQVTVNANAEPSFASDVPRDARYRVREIEVKLIRNGDPVKVQTFKKNKITLTTFAQQARKGDLYIFTIKRVVRTNFQNKSENVPARNEIYKVLVKSN